VLSADVTVSKSDVGLGNATNTSDANKPVSTAQQAALDLKASAIAYFNGSGALTAPTKRWVGLVTPSTGNGAAIDISAASFASILSVQVIAIKNTAAATSSPNVSVKSITTSTLTLNITEANATLVNLLGSNVPLGLPIGFANVTGLTLYVIVEGS
jgi:hypothetical protein